MFIVWDDYESEQQHGIQANTDGSYAFAWHGGITESAATTSSQDQVYFTLYIDQVRNFTLNIDQNEDKTLYIDQSRDFTLER